jgi:hypothetical protein
MEITQRSVAKSNVFRKYSQIFIMRFLLAFSIPREPIAEKYFCLPRQVNCVSYPEQTYGLQVRAEVQRARLATIWISYEAAGRMRGVK